ncbi:hypothetical protein PYJP_09570 [Pyrofollis japonicus]|uniref:hypothetical protein n=1 Tax=Pyrofollis japonicus TaxID=3060460 RepID=UPI00295BD91B|nr:hypothetical protein [Pyrofollis japonicus]BEP17605.1 hypothetical protein PYJP_09570 [Pyrofollis japonicus]
MPCPWYQNGVCTSPKLGKPSSAVVSKERCLGSEAEYKSCRFYVDPEASKKQSPLEAAMKPALEKQLRPYTAIHLLSTRPRSECPFMRVYNYGGGYLAFCEVLNRLLTRSEVTKCERYWSTCPFYKMGIKART